MAKEIEAKFININKPDIVGKLKDLGAVKVFDEHLLRRCVYNLPFDKSNAWARVRDEVDKVTMSYKCINAESLDGVEEIELTVSSFDDARDFLKAVGLKEKAYQETKRMRYVIECDDIEFDIDTWPGLNPWIEIEGYSEEKVKEYAQKLGFKWEDAMFGSADYVYAKIYKIENDWINNHCPILKFGKLPLELQKDNMR